MATWKVLLVMLMAVACLALATASLVVPLTLVGAERWLTLAALLFATGVVGTLFALFLRHADKTYR